MSRGNIHSKSKRKARAVKYAAVFKAVDEARVARLSAKLAAIPQSQGMSDAVTGGDIVMTEGLEKERPKQPSARNGRRGKSAGFNAYGLSRREIHIRIGTNKSAPHGCIFAGHNGIIDNRLLLPQLRLVAMGNAFGRPASLVIGYCNGTAETSSSLETDTESPLSPQNRQSQPPQPQLAVESGSSNGNMNNAGGLAAALTGRRPRTAPVPDRPCEGSRQRNGPVRRAYEDLSEVLRDYELLNAEEALAGWGRPVRVRPRPHSLLPVAVKDDTAMRVSLRSRQIVCLTPEIGTLDMLQVLDLSDNQLTFLPDQFGPGLRWLEELNLSDNRLVRLPETFGLLKRLQSLSLDHNLLCDLPTSLVLLKRLRRLSLAHNQFTEVPPCVLLLPRLQHLDLQNNYQLRILPAELAAQPRLHFVKVMGCDLYEPGRALTRYCSRDSTPGPPSLLECCLRVMLRVGREGEFSSLPLHLQIEVRQSLRTCSFCEEPILWHWVTRARSVQRPGERLCLRYRMCRLHFWSEHSRTKAMFGEQPTKASLLVLRLLQEQFEGQWVWRVKAASGLSHPTIVIAATDGDPDTPAG